MTTRNAFSKAHALWAKFAAELPHPVGAEAGAPGLKLFAKKSDTEGALYVYDFIGEEWYGAGVTAKAVQAALAELVGVKTLNVFINSPGGDVFEAKAIVAQLQRFDAKDKIMHVDGVAASAASFIAVAGGTKVVTSPHANWMIHEASGMAFGRAQDMRDMADRLDLQNGDLANAYAAKMGKSVDDVLALMNAETWFTAAQALEHKLTDEISGEPEDEKKKAQAAALERAPLMAACASLDERVRQIRQERRVRDLKTNDLGRASSARTPGQPGK